jgi:hypothetical protein
MPRSAAVMLLCLLIGAGSIAAAEKKKQVKPARPVEEIKPEDLKVVAAMEDLKLIDLAEDMDMLKDKDIDYLIEDNENENKKN